MAVTAAGEGEGSLRAAGSLLAWRWGVSAAFLAAGAAVGAGWCGDAARGAFDGLALGQAPLLPMFAVDAAVVAHGVAGAIGSRSRTGRTLGGLIALVGAAGLAAEGSVLIALLRAS